MTSADTLLDRPSPRLIVADALLALAAGWLLYWLSCSLLAPHDVVHGQFASDWQRMSVDPLSFPGSLPHRILVPFLAWAFGCGGEGYVAFVRGLNVLLLASAFFAVRRLGGRYLDGLLVAAAIAITAPVQLYKQHWVGYTDPICYTLFIWMMLVARSPYVFWALFLTNLMNHELAGFLLPWLWYLRRREDQRWRLDLVCIAVTCGLYLAYYFWVKANVNQTYSIDYFMSHPLFPGGSFAVWNLAAVHLTCTFGPVLALLAWHQHARGERGERWHLWLVSLGVLVIFCIAFDWARHSNLILLPLIVAGTRFLARGNNNRLLFIGLLGLTLFLFWLVPPWSATAWPTNVFFHGTDAWRATHPDKLFLVEIGVLLPQVGPGGVVNIGFGSLATVLGEWVPRIWKPLAVVHAIGITIWCAGWGWARYQNRATS
ncbi:MAG TPA: hypothetical protein EYP98_10285 [Planctomycetes bacterium]|nr:hypothetical protein [Planctomycetota bacterium]